MGKDEGGKGGVVVNIASIAGLAPSAVCPVYVAKKHAVIGLTRSFGVSTACSNVDILY
jgi:short-subunit dehydrogenase